MNVLVWSSWVSRPVGGMERIALELALRLHQHGDHVVLIGPYEKAEELQHKIPTDFPYHSFDIHRRRVKPHLAAARLLDRCIRKHRIEIVSAHGSVLAPHEVCRLRKIPMVWTVHGAEPRKRGGLEWIKTLAVSRVIGNPNTHIVAVSQATAEVLRLEFSKLANDRLHVIYNGAPEEASLTAMELPPAGPPWNLGFIGRLVERKRPLDLVDMARCLEDTLDFHVHVFGDGPLYGRLAEAVVANGLQDKFTFHGYWKNGSAGMFGQVQILVHPDCAEPFGGAVLEAQLAGRPVAAYNVGGNPEIVRNGATGLLVDSGNTTALAAAVAKLTKQDYKSFALEARTRATAEFPLSKMIDEYRALFRRICRKN